MLDAYIASVTKQRVSFASLSPLARIRRCVPRLAIADYAHLLEEPLGSASIGAHPLSLDVKPQELSGRQHELLFQSLGARHSTPPHAHASNS